MKNDELASALPGASREARSARQPCYNEARIFRFPYAVLLKLDEEGDVLASVPELKGCMAHGHDVDSALTNLNDMLSAYLLMGEEIGAAETKPMSADQIDFNCLANARPPATITTTTVERTPSDSTATPTEAKP